MALSNMIAEMRGAVPGSYSAALARTHLQEAWQEIRDETAWSFQCAQGGFTTPAKINVGSAAVTFGSPTVVLNSTAAAAVLANGSQYGSLITQRQFRVGASTIYNIIGFDGINTLTLDRPWIDLASGPGLGYSIYQCYYPAPVANFEAWEAVLDVVNVKWLNTSPSKSERERMDRADPQRQIFSVPGTVLSVGADARPGSSTLGWMLFELYPQPQSAFSYQTWYTWDGPDLADLSDTLPYPMTESVVKSLARVKAYEWVEANRDPNNPRGTGGDMRFLMEAARAQYEAKLKPIRLKDQNLVDLWRATMTRLSGMGPLATFNPSTGTVMSRNL